MSALRCSLAILVTSLLALPAPADAGPDELKFEIDGYYRARWHLFTNLYDKDFPRDGGRDVTSYYVDDVDTRIPPNYADAWRSRNPGGFPNDLVQSYCREVDRFQPAANRTCRRSITNPHVSTWFVQKGRFEPTLSFRGIKAKITIDVLDNVVWGDNENLATTPLFAGNPSTTQVDGTVTDSIAVKRLWVEWSTAFGLIRLGRQPSNWGMGLLANDGDGFKNDFGDAYQGTVYDRFIFATRPYTLVKGIAAILEGGTMPKAEDDPGIIFAIGFDKLVESSAIPFRKAITDNDNVSDENDEDAGVRRSPIWLSDRGDDVWEMIFVLMFKRENWDVGNGNLMDLTLGTYWVNRRQAETDSNIWIGDFYLDWKLRGVFAQFEIYYIFGTSDGLAPSWEKTTRASIPGFAGRIGYKRGPLTALVEFGYAAGDDVILDDEFKGRALHRDHNVGLILYEQVLAQRTTERFAANPDTQGLWSNGGVYNSTYINPRVKLAPGDIFEIRLGFLMAWANEVDGAVIPYLGDESITTGITESKLLGTEVDLGLHMKWADGHILSSLEMGYMHAGPRLARMSQYADPSDPTLTSLNILPYTQAQYNGIQRRLENIFTMQLRMAFIF
jgi:hypothetical protein